MINRRDNFTLQNASRSFKFLSLLKKMSNKPLPQTPKDEKSLNNLSSSDEKSLNDLSSSNEKDHSTNTQQVGTNNHPHLTAVKEVVSGAVHNATQALKIPKESHPEAYHQDGKSGPE